MSVREPLWQSRRAALEEHLAQSKLKAETADNRFELDNGSLVAVLLETTATLTDEILDLHDRFIGGLFNKAKRKHDEV